MDQFCNLHDDSISYLLSSNCRHTLLEKSQYMEQALAFDSRGCNNNVTFLEIFSIPGILNVTGLTYKFALRMPPPQLMRDPAATHHSSTLPTVNPAV
jgi:hypothetical protein